MQKKNKIHVLICNCPAGVLFYNYFINNIKEEYIVIEFYKSKLLDKNINKNIKSFLFNNRFKYLIKLIEARRLLKKITCEYQEMHFYISHSVTPLINDYFYNENINIKFSFYPDGLGYYIENNPLITKANFLKIEKIKKIILKFLGIKYFIGETTYFNNQKKIETIFSFLDENRVLNSNLLNLSDFKLIDLKKIIKYEKIKKDRSILIISNFHLLKKNDFKKKILYLLIKLNENFLDYKIYYKPHPQENYNLNWKKNFFQSNNINLLLMETNAEKLAYSFDVFVGYCSTSLIYIKNINKKAVVWSIYPNNNIEDEIIKIAKLNQVEVIKFNNEG